jgi:hypothetical protein
VQEWHGIRDTVIRDMERKMLQKEPRMDKRARRDIGRARNATVA